jgi:hypothetical protein
VLLPPVRLIALQCTFPLVEDDPIIRNPSMSGQSILNIIVITHLFISPAVIPRRSWLLLTDSKILLTLSPSICPANTPGWSRNHWLCLNGSTILLLWSPFICPRNIPRLHKCLLTLSKCLKKAAKIMFWTILDYVSIL